MYDAPSYAPPTQPAFRAMTLDDVVVRSFMTLGTLVVAAAAAWYLDVSPGVAIGAAIVALILGLIVSFTQSTNPALILGYAAFEGVFLGTISSLFEGQISGIVLQAVLGTAMAFGGVLAVYTLRIVRVTPKLVRYVIAAAIAALGLIVVNLVAGIFVPGGLGLRDRGPARHRVQRRDDPARLLLPAPRLRLDRAGRQAGRPGQVRLAVRLRAHPEPGLDLPRGAPPLSYLHQ